MARNGNRHELCGAATNRTGVASADGSGSRLRRTEVSRLGKAHPNATLAPYAATKAAIANFSASLAQLLGDKGIRVNSVAPGPIWTPLIPSTMPPESVESFGDNTPLASPKAAPHRSGPRPRLPVSVWRNQRGARAAGHVCQ